MRKMANFVAGGLVLLTTGCSTLSESFQLGGVAGALAGAGAAYTGHKGAGGEPTLKNVVSGAGIGLAAGLIVSYFVHKAVEDDRRVNNQSGPEMHFGDLPPSPFVIPNNKSKGVR